MGCEDQRGTVAKVSYVFLDSFVTYFQNPSSITAHGRAGILN